MDLFTTLRALNLSGINAAAEFGPDGDVYVWLGDARNGICDAAQFSRISQAAEWLSSSAEQHYPHSDFTKVRRFIAAVARGAANQQGSV
jgi:roadblock/LC7 domain-containing protein